MASLVLDPAGLAQARRSCKSESATIKLINARVFAKIKEDEMNKFDAEKSEIMGGGNRSERIRTYNFPQDRCTDHRCKFSHHGLEQIMSDGELVDIFSPHMERIRQEFLLKSLE